jgi:hypothetical protein
MLRILRPKLAFTNMAGSTDSEKDHRPENTALGMDGPGSPSQEYIPADCWPMAKKVWVTFIIWYV